MQKKQNTELPKKRTTDAESDSEEQQAAKKKKDPCSIEGTWKASEKWTFITFRVDGKFVYGDFDNVYDFMIGNIQPDGTVTGKFGASDGQKPGRIRIIVVSDDSLEISISNVRHLDRWHRLTAKRVISGEQKATQ